MAKLSSEMHPMLDHAKLCRQTFDDVENFRELLSSFVTQRFHEMSCTKRDLDYGGVLRDG